MDSIEIIDVLEKPALSNINNEIIEILSSDNDNIHKHENEKRHELMLNSIILPGNSYEDSGLKDEQEEINSKGQRKNIIILEQPSSPDRLANDSILDSSFSFIAREDSTIQTKPMVSNSNSNSNRAILDVVNWLSDSDDDSGMVIDPSTTTKTLKENKETNPDAMHRVRRETNINEKDNAVAGRSVSRSISAADLSDPIMTSSPSIPVSNYTSTRNTIHKRTSRRGKKSIKNPLAGEPYSKKELNEANKVTRKKEDLLSEMIIQISLGLYEKHFEDEYMKEKFVHPKIEKNYTSIPMISWKRKVKAKYDAKRDIFIPCEPTEISEKNIVLYFKAKDFVNSLIEGTLQLSVEVCKTKVEQNSQSGKYHLIIIVEGYVQFLNKIRNMEDKKYKKAVLDKLNPNDDATSERQKKQAVLDMRNPNDVNATYKKQKKQTVEEVSLSPKEIDQLVNEYQVTLGVNIFPVKNNQDAINWLHSFTYTIAYALYDKFERNISLANLGTVKSGTDTKSTYFQTVKQFRLMTEPKVEKLYGFYTSVFALYSRFQSNNSLGKDSFDKNIVPPSTEAAMKKLFTTDDPNDVVHE